MKMTLLKFLLCIAAPLTSLSAQEAWLLEMPNKYADYLVKKSVEKDFDAVAGIIGKIPSLIASKQITELELISFKATEGKVNKKSTLTEGSRTLTLGASYRSSAGTSLDRRTLKITTAPTERNFNIQLFGFLPRSWTTTFAHRGEKLTILLLERHAESESAVIELKNSRQLTFDAGPEENLVTWYSGDALDGQNLSYTAQAALAANPEIAYGTKIFTSIKKGADSLIRIEANSTPKDATDIVHLHHNEAKFNNLSETSGPLKKEIIKIADKSFTKEAESGKWSLTLTD